MILNEMSVLYLQRIPHATYRRGVQYCCLIKIGEVQRWRKSSEVTAACYNTHDIETYQPGCEYEAVGRNR
jgi:hypothetical protein